MPAEPTFWMIAAVTTIGALLIASHAALKGWRDWLDLRRLEIETRRDGPAPSPTAASRIELADLKERLRKLEAIAAGVDL